MAPFFLTVFNMSLTASWLVLCVILLRLLLKKAPKAVHCFLWVLVALRLILPFSFESALSLIPNAEPIPPEILEKPVTHIDTGIPVINTVINPIIEEQTVPQGSSEANLLALITEYAAVIWIVGMLALAVYGMISYWMVRKSVRVSVREAGNVYLCDGIPSPFILGLIRPKIYLPSNLEDGQKTYILAHEDAHLSRCDHLWKPLGFLLLIVHWFNPLLWAAYILLCRDIELACDERVVRKMDEREKKEYSMTLLACSVPRRRLQACPLAFGEVGVKERVKNVLNYKKPAFWLILLAVILCAAAVVFFMTDPLGEKAVKLKDLENIGEDYLETLDNALDATICREGSSLNFYRYHQDRYMTPFCEAIGELELLPVKESIGGVDWNPCFLMDDDASRRFEIRADADYQYVSIGSSESKAKVYKLKDPDWLRGYVDAALDVPTSYTDFEGISISVEKVDLTSEKPYIELMWTNNTDEEFTFGEGFDIDRKSGDKWFGCSTDVLYFDMIANLLPARTSIIKRYNLDLFDLSKPGVYRIYIQKDSQGALWSEFSIPFTGVFADPDSEMSIVGTVHRYSWVSDCDRAAFMLDLSTGKATFNYSLLSDDILQGTYKWGTEELTVDCGNDGIYTFDIVDGGFAFNAAKSAEVPKYSYGEDAPEEIVCVPDGAVFRRSVDRSFVVNTAWAGYSDDEELNQIETPTDYSVRNLPVRVVLSEWGIENFKKRFGTKVDLSGTNGEMQSFEQAIAKYNDEWFKENALAIVYVRSGSSNLRYTVERIDSANYGGALRIFVKSAPVAEVGNTVMGGYWLLVELGQDLLSGEGYVDAVLDSYSGNDYGKDDFDTMIDKVAEKEYAHRLNLRHSTVAKVIQDFREDEKMRKSYENNEFYVVDTLRFELNELLPFRTKGSLVAPFAPETYAEAREYVEKEFKWYQENRPENSKPKEGEWDPFEKYWTDEYFNELLDRMENEASWQIESPYSKTPQQNFDNIRGIMFNTYVPQERKTDFY